MKTKTQITVEQLVGGDYILLNGSLHKLIKNEDGSFVYFLFKDIIHFESLELSTFDPGFDWKDLKSWNWLPIDRRFAQQKFYRLS